MSFRPSLTPIPRRSPCTSFVIASQWPVQRRLLSSGPTIRPPLPWPRLGEDLPNLGEPNVNPFTRWVVIPIQRRLTEGLSGAFARSAYGPSYFEREILLGTSVAFLSFVSRFSQWTLSAPSSTPRTEIESQIRPLLSRTLHATLARQVDRLHPNTRVRLTVLSTHDAQLDSIDALFGDDLHLSVPPRLSRISGALRVYDVGPLHYLFRWLHLGFVYTREDIQDGSRSSWDLSSEAMAKGAVIRARVRVDATVVMDVFELDEEGQELPSIEDGDGGVDVEAAKVLEKLRVFTHVQRQDFYVVLESPHLTVQDAEMRGGVKAGNWRIADIDDIVEADNYARYKRREERE
ncbi:hypothetical protein BJ742DRAFT_189422 [Cladochytrium replicatum]|nr:hypothetical protein BJ742DRAFT_189422 [Cladochytrium replicatum]